MKQKPAKTAIDEYGYLVSADDFRSPSSLKLCCFHCSCPVTLVLAKAGEEAHFLHDLTLLAPGEAMVCPSLYFPFSAERETDESLVNNRAGPRIRG